MSQDRDLCGCQMPMEDWININRTTCFEDDDVMSAIAPFPPSLLMENVSGLNTDRDFASHGCDIYEALSKASAVPLADYRKILDFGCGCGRLARLFKGHPHEIHGCDIDHRHVKWMQENLLYVQTTISTVHPPLPYEVNSFDAIISISIFTHLNESSQDEFLAELQRVCAHGGKLFLTIHGNTALQRAKSDPKVKAMLDIDDSFFTQAEKQFFDDQHAFILQDGHLTQRNTREHKLKTSFGEKVIDQNFEYGITFVSENYIYDHWSKWFNILAIYPGAIHAFQDIVVLSPIQMSL